MGLISMSTNHCLLLLLLEGFLSKKMKELEFAWDSNKRRTEKWLAKT
jgi:hypothetical protein